MAETTDLNNQQTFDPKKEKGVTSLYSYEPIFPVSENKYGGIYGPGIWFSLPQVTSNINMVKFFESSAELLKTDFEGMPRYVVVYKRNDINKHIIVGVYAIKLDDENKFLVVDDDNLLPFKYELEKIKPADYN